ncbi:uncharacterized protein LOC100165393 precursor [Acyrthosiphon pisum]|uniref:ACYPI006346 protein n=1 Tax=Acyrthosiphon pisum TaxID=7029 RepID=C4WVJ2_ACYPI|nr:uncharacterized protein LOC100165393 precursor [Acyrthosiphon pisum]AQR58534.1 Mp1-like effector [Acyrthosiphon pisum]BAH71912.1 ACYPI006346 [Acyrthosiphon pisum]|eukprot:NP_001155659.1 uncharacterized protein LOC100165393 precursor [Acyrthosiphon pisum]
MTVKISVFAVVLIVTCVRASLYQPPPPTLSMSMPYMPNYPVDCPSFNEFKKSVYTLNQALANIIAAARSVYNYHTLYKNQPGLNMEINEKKEIFDKALNFFENKLLKYRQALINYKALLEYSNNSPVITVDDDIPIDRELL